LSTLKLRVPESKLFIYLNDPFRAGRLSVASLQSVDPIEYSLLSILTTSNVCERIAIEFFGCGRSCK
jgi:hypothetical protein